MREDILKIARKKFDELSKKYDSFINVVVDDWRGFRFVYDTEDVRKCNNDCQNCSLYNLLINEKSGVFSAALYPASDEDKEMFGPQRFLNCKTLEQYKKCYLNYLDKCKSVEEIKEEINLVKNMRIIYPKNSEIIEYEFKEEIINKYINFI